MLPETHSPSHVGILQHIQCPQTLCYKCVCERYGGLQRSQAKMGKCFWVLDENNTKIKMETCNKDQNEFQRSTLV
jgi:hypothetical protein